MIMVVSVLQYYAKGIGYKPHKGGEGMQLGLRNAM